MQKGRYTATGGREEGRWMERVGVEGGGGEVQQGRCGGPRGGDSPARHLLTAKGSWRMAPGVSAENRRTRKEPVVSGDGYFSDWLGWNGSGLGLCAAEVCGK